MDWLTFYTTITITITEKNKVRLRCIIKELEALGAITELDGEFIINGSECVGKENGA